MRRSSPTQTVLKRYTCGLIPRLKKIENARICWTTIDIKDLEMVITKEIVKIQAKKIQSKCYTFRNGIGPVLPQNAYENTTLSLQLFFC